MYDLIILGGGPAGYRAAERAGHFGLNTLLFEARALGGVCLNEGCVPSKTFLHSAKVFDYARHGEAYGVTTSGASLDHRAVLARKAKVVSTLVGGIGSLMKKNKIEVIKERARITGRVDGGFSVEAGGKRYEGKKLLLCTGSEAVMPPIPGAKEGFEAGRVLTNREILDLPVLPETLTVIGGGVIGLEMASYFNSAGAKVTVVEMLDKIAGPTDGEISSLLQKSYEKKGVTFVLGAKVTALSPEGVTFEKDGKCVLVPSEKVLMSVGRRAVTRDVGLESIGLVTERGAVVTDEQMKTNVPGVFAAGDVNGKSMLAHTAYREAEVAVSNIVGKKDAMRYTAIPSVIYTNPEAAAAGETLESALSKGLKAYEKKVPLAYSGRYLAENSETDGIAKLVLERDGNRLLGVHMLGNPSSEIIYGACLMIEKELRPADLETLVFPHPTVGEILREMIF